MLRRHSFRTTVTHRDNCINAPRQHHHHHREERRREEEELISRQRYYRNFRSILYLFRGEGENDTPLHACFNNIAATWLDTWLRFERNYLASSRARKFVRAKFTIDLMAERKRELRNWIETRWKRRRKRNEQIILIQ